MPRMLLKDNYVLKVSLPLSVFKTGRLIQGKKPAKILAWIMQEVSNQRTVGQYRKWRRKNKWSGENEGLGGYLPTLIDLGIVKTVPRR